MASERGVFYADANRKSRLTSSKSRAKAYETAPVAPPDAGATSKDKS